MVTILSNEIIIELNHKVNPMRELSSNAIKYINLLNNHLNKLFENDFDKQQEVFKDEITRKLPNFLGKHSKTIYMKYINETLNINNLKELNQNAYYLIKLYVLDVILEVAGNKVRRIKKDIIEYQDIKDAIIKDDELSFVFKDIILM
jgi:hypothetical protein